MLAFIVGATIFGGNSYPLIFWYIQNDGSGSWTELADGSGNWTEVNGYGY